jgi:hypothetical protein
MFGDGAPTFVRDFAEIIQHHIALVGGDAIFDFPKQRFAPIRDDDHEIRVWLGVIISPDADRSAVVLMWVEFWMRVACHGIRLFGQGQGVESILLSSFSVGGKLKKTPLKTSNLSGAGGNCYFNSNYQA